MMKPCFYFLFIFSQGNVDANLQIRARVLGDMIVLRIYLFGFVAFRDIRKKN